MIRFKEIDDANPLLAISPLVGAMEKTFAYIAANGPIGLTPSNGFKRVFVDWAAAEFAWPGYTNEDLFAVNKVLNEIDFPPLMDLHDVMIDLKIGRHYKNAFRLTKSGETLVGHPGKIFGIVIPFFLFEMNHSTYARTQTQPLRNWDTLRAQSFPVANLAFVFDTFSLRPNTPTPSPCCAFSGPEWMKGGGDIPLHIVS